ncbi:aromatic-ring hydroxylase C-terminal domain-containing protein, partial [Bordetella pertussis]
ADMLDALRALQQDEVPVQPILVCDAGAAPAAAPAGVRVVEDSEGWLARRYDARPGTCYLIRPDQHIAARFRAFDAQAVRRALARAIGRA